MYEILLCIFLVDTFIPLMSFTYGYKHGNSIKEFNNKYLSNDHIFNKYIFSVPNFKDPFLTNGFIFKIIYSSYYNLFLLNKYPRIDDNIINYLDDIESYIETKNLKGYAHLGFTTSLLKSYK